MSATDSPGPTAAAPSRAAHVSLLVALLAAICLLAHFNRTSISTAANLRIMEQYGISTQAMGSVYSAFLLAYTLAMIPGGWLIDRRGPKYALAWVCLGSAAFVALTGAIGLVANSATSALTMFLVVRSAMGLVSAPLHPAAAKAVALGVPAGRRSAANGLITGAALLGVAATSPGFGRLVDQLDWPLAFGIAAAVTAALGCAWLWLADPAVARPTLALVAVAEENARSQRRIPGSEASMLTLLTLSYATVGYAQYLFFYWLHFYFDSVLKLDPERSRWYAAIPPVAMAVGMPLGGLLSDRLERSHGWRAGRSGLALVSMSACAALVVLGARATEPGWIVTWFALALGMLGLAEGPFWSTAVEVGGRRGGMSAAIFNTGGNVGGMLAPIVTPWLSDGLQLGWQTGIMVGGGVCLAGGALWYWIDRPMERDRGNSTLGTEVVLEP